MRYSFKKRKIEKVVESVVASLKAVQWKYKTLILFVMSLVVAYFFLRNTSLQLAVPAGNAGYAIVFFVSIFFTFSLTSFPAAAALFMLSRKLNPFLVAATGAAGALIGDYLIFRFVKDNLIKEIKLLSDHINSKYTYHFKKSIFYRLFPFSNLILWPRFNIIKRKIAKSQIYQRLIKILSVGLLASPLPDELAVTFLGTMDQKTKNFLIYTYISKFLGILGIAGASRLNNN